MHRSTPHKRFLEEFGYISRETGKEDRRENNLYVSESGEKLVPVIREILRDWAKSVTRDLSDEERILLITLLDRLIHIRDVGVKFHFDMSCHTSFKAAGVFSLKKLRNTPLFRRKIRLDRFIDVKRRT